MPMQRNSLEYLLAELRRITALVSNRVEQIAANLQGEDDEFRGLHISEEEIRDLLTDPNLFLAGSYEVGLEPAFGLSDSRLGHLQKVFRLSPFELDVVLIALAPELDLRYEKIYAYLQDDVTRRRPNIDLTLRLLCPGLAGQVAARHCFDSEAPLLKYRLIELGEESQGRQTGLLSRPLKLDEGVVAYLLGQDKLDTRLRQVADFADLTERLYPNLDEEETHHIIRLVELASESEQGGFICGLIGTDEESKRRLAAEVARRLGRSLLVVQSNLLANQPRLENTVRLLEREAGMRSALLYWVGYEALLNEEAPVQEAARLVIRTLKEQNGPACFVSSNQSLGAVLAGPGQREFQIELAMPGYSARQQIWESLLGAGAVGLDLEGLSSRFRLGSGQIAAAAMTARNAAAWRGETVPTLADLEAACRRHSNHRLSSLARKITPKYRWNDIVLPLDQFSMLSEMCEQVKHRSLVYEKWGFENKLSLGKGLNVVFAGPSGTGKTMAAEIIAGELRMDLYKIDLSNVVSKYIGETEKNLERIFTEAGESNAILFFDEADSIFGKRSEVKDAHDRYANIETGYLLQKMEEYEGIVVLATNLRKNLDDAFVRRMHFMLEFPFPEEEDRLRIWERVFPKEVPLSENVDLHFMARQFKIAGGNIKNIGLTAAFLAAADSSTSWVEMAHLIRATRREFQKIGKLCTETDFGPYFGILRNLEAKPAHQNGTKFLVK